MRSNEFLGKYPYIVLWIIAGISFFAATYNLWSSYHSQNFILQHGHIECEKTHTRLRKSGSVKEYDYRITWEDEEGTHEHKYTNQVDFHPDGDLDIWVSPDKTEVHLSSSEGIRADVPLFYGISIVAFILGILVWKRLCKVS